MAVEAVLLDLDGTVWDSRPWFARLVAGDGASETQIAELCSVLETKSAATLLRAKGLDRRFAERCSAEQAHLHLYDGVGHTLRTLRGKGVPLGAVTNLPGWVVVPMLDGAGIESYFTTLVAYGRTSRHKPFADPILAALRDLRLSPSPAIWYVGDAEQDAAAARNAGVSFAWASYGYGSLTGSPKSLKSFEDVLYL